MTKVIKVKDDIRKKMVEFYKENCREKTPPFALFQAQDGDTVITLYESGTAVFQGKNADIDANMWITMGEDINAIKNDINREFEKEEIDFNDKETIGSDEVGTGDYFGPIIVTACYVSKENIKKVTDLGVGDSKGITDEKILEVVPSLVKIVPYESIILSAKEYNKKHDSDKLNLNKIKAIMHNKVLNKMKNKKYSCDYIVVDQFTSEKLYYRYLENINEIAKDLTFLIKAENKCLSVACASMISRFIFLKEFEKLEKEYNTILPKGAGEQVDKTGKELVEKYGESILDDIAKTNFKNTERIIEK